MRLSRSGMFRSRSGNTAIIFAILAPVLILVAGGAIDVTNASMRQAQLQQAVDAATIAAVARTSPGFKAAVLMPGDGALPDILTMPNAQAVFNANWLSPNGTSAPQVTGTACNGGTLVCKSGLVVSSQMIATSQFTTAFLGMFGMHTIKLGAKSYASDNIPPYVNFYMLLDNTDSMGLGATSADIAALQNMTAGNSEDANCAFSCHTTQDLAVDYYDQARKQGGITLRIDEVSSATANLMTTATKTETANGLPPPPVVSSKNPACQSYGGPAPEFNVAIYDFGSAAYVSPGLTNVSQLQTCLSQSASDANGVQLMMVPSNNYVYSSPCLDVTTCTTINNNDEDSDFTYILNKMVDQIGIAGSGANATSPQKILFMVTDGMADKDSLNGRLMGGINTANCTTIKNNGAQIAILYTTYTPASIASDTWSQAYAAPKLPEIAPALQSCASPGLYYEVDPSNGSISQAMAALFNKVLASVKLTPPTS